MAGGGGEDSDGSGGSGHEAGENGARTQQGRCGRRARCSGGPKHVPAAEWTAEEVQGPAGLEDAPLRPSAKGTRVPFQKRHPQSHTHCITVRTTPVLPQICKDVPSRPPPDAPADKLERYAAFALGCFASDRLDLPRHDASGQPLTLWARFRAWEQLEECPVHGLGVRLGKTLLHNIDTRACARERIARERDPHQKQVAAVHAPLETLPAFDHPLSGLHEAEGYLGQADDSDDTDDDAAFPRRHHQPERDPDTINWETWDADTAAIANHLLNSAAAADFTDDYSAAAFAALPDLHAQPGHGAALAAPVPASSLIQPTGGQDTARVLADLKASATAARLLATKATPGDQSALREGESPADARLCVRGEGKHVSARLVVLAPGLADEAKDAEALREGSTRCVRQQDLPQAAPPPFIKVAGPPPSIAHTLRLHSLSASQQFAFALAAEVLQQEQASRTAARSGKQPLADQPAIPRLRMLLLGEPGTGKSRVIRALLWYSYQLDAADLVRTTSFTWRACQMINTISHTAVSSCRLFGLGVADERTSKAAVVIPPP